MPFKIIRNDITKVKADAIVNSANPYPVIGSGTDTAVYNAAGAELVLRERREIGRIARGEAAVTGAYNLKAKIIIHTVGPGWIDGNHGESEILRNCYRNSLALAAKHECRSIAFPLIATGNYGFPKDMALNIALDEIGKFLLTHDMTVTMVVFDPDSFKLSEKLFDDIEQYINDHEEHFLAEEEYLSNIVDPGVHSGEESEEYRRERLRRARQASRENTDGMIEPSFSACFDYGTASEKLDKPVRFSMKDDAGGESVVDDREEKKKAKPATEDDLESLLGRRSESFRDMLFKLIDKSGRTDADVYKEANIDRKLFSSIRCKENYTPKKATAVALAIALKLDIETMEDLLSRAGYALSYSSKFDLIIRYFASREQYNIMEINAALFEYGQPLLGSA